MALLVLLPLCVGVAYNSTSGVALKVTNVVDHISIYNIEMTLRFSMDYSAWTPLYSDMLIASVAKVCELPQANVWISSLRSGSVIVTVVVQPLPPVRAVYEVLMQTVALNFQNMSLLLTQMSALGFPDVKAEVTTQPHAPAMDDVVGSLITEFQNWKLNTTVAMQKMYQNDLSVRGMLTDQIQTLQTQVNDITAHIALLEAEAVAVKTDITFSLPTKTAAAMSAAKELQTQYSQVNGTVALWLSDRSNYTQLLARDYDDSMQLLQQVTELLNVDNTTQLTNQSEQFFNTIASRNSFTCDSRDQMQTQIQKLVEHLNNRINANQLVLAQFQSAVSDLEANIALHTNALTQELNHFEQLKQFAEARLESIDTEIQAAIARRSSHKLRISRLEALLQKVGGVLQQRDVAFSNVINARSLTVTLMKMFQTQQAAETQ